MTLFYKEQMMQKISRQAQYEIGGGRQLASVGGATIGAALSAHKQLVRQGDAAAVFSHGLGMGTVDLVQSNGMWYVNLWTEADLND